MIKHTFKALLSFIVFTALHYLSFLVEPYSVNLSGFTLLGAILSLLYLAFIITLIFGDTIGLTEDL